MILGIDWGQRKIGFAIAYEEVTIATALSVIENDNNVFNVINAIIEENEVNLIVIGRSEHQTQNDNSNKIDAFAQKCRESCGVSVEFVSEMFTTREAQSNLIAAGKKNVSQNDDAESARVILQQYLDVKKEKV